MATLAALGILISLIGFVAGLLKPSLFEGIFKERANKKFLSRFFFFLFFLSIIVFVISTDEEDKAAKDLEAQKTDELIKNVNPENAEGTIRKVVQSELHGNNNRNKPYLKNLDINMVGGEALITIDYSVDENLTNNLAKTDMESKMCELYTKLYKNKLPINAVAISCFVPLMDKYGNEEEGEVYSTFLDKEEAAKINWSKDESELRALIIPNVWKTRFIHPELLKE